MPEELKIQWALIAGRASLETLIQIGLITIMINILEAFGLSILFFQTGIFRSILECATAIIAIFLGMLFLSNFLFGYAEYRARLNSRNGWLIIDAITETAFFCILAWVIFWILNDFQILSIWIENPAIFIICIGVIIIIANFLMAKYIAKKDIRKDDPQRGQIIF